MSTRRAFSESRETDKLEEEKTLPWGCNFGLKEVCLHHRKSLLFFVWIQAIPLTPGIVLFLIFLQSYPSFGHGHHILPGKGGFPSCCKNSGLAFIAVKALEELRCKARYLLKKLDVEISTPLESTLCTEPSKHEIGESEKNGCNSFCNAAIHLYQGLADVWYGLFFSLLGIQIKLVETMLAFLAIPYTLGHKGS